MPRPPISSFFFFNDTATTEIYTLSLHDALPISRVRQVLLDAAPHLFPTPLAARAIGALGQPRSEEHTSELQSQSNLVCRLLLEKKKKQQTDLHRRYHATRRSSCVPPLHRVDCST